MRLKSNSKLLNREPDLIQQEDAYNSQKKRGKTTKYQKVASGSISNDKIQPKEPTSLIF